MDNQINTETYMDDAREMFMTQGWKNFMIETEESIKAVRVESLEDEVAFHEAKGALNMMYRVLGYEAYIKHLEEQEEEDYAEDL